MINKIKISALILIIPATLAHSKAISEVITANTSHESKQVHEIKACSKDEWLSKVQPLASSNNWGISLVIKNLDKNLNETSEAPVFVVQKINSNEEEFRAFSVIIKKDLPVAIISELTTNHLNPDISNIKILGHIKNLDNINVATLNDEGSLNSAVSFSSLAKNFWSLSFANPEYFKIISFDDFCRPVKLSDDMSGDDVSLSYDDSNHLPTSATVSSQKNKVASKIFFRHAVNLENASNLEPSWDYEDIIKDADRLLMEIPGSPINSIK